MLDIIDSQKIDESINSVSYEEPCYKAPDNPKRSHRLAFLMFKFCEVGPVVRIAEILDRSKMSLWRNDLLLLQNQLQNYKIPAVNKISVDEVYAKAHHSNARKPLRPFFHNNRRLRNP